MLPDPYRPGGAGSGESEIRRYVLENDLLEAIIALELGGRVEVRVGTGIFVLGPRPEPKQAHGRAIDK